MIRLLREEVKFAEEIKKHYKNTLIVIGGPNISLIKEKNIELLEKNDFVDILVRGDGEAVVCNMSHFIFFSATFNNIG